MQKWWKRTLWCSLQKRWLSSCLGAAMPDLCSLSPWPATFCSRSEPLKFLPHRFIYMLLRWCLSCVLFLELCLLFVCCSRPPPQFTLEWWSCPSTTKHSRYWMEKVSENKQTITHNPIFDAYISTYLDTPSVFLLEPRLQNLILNGHFHPVWKAFSCTACGSWFFTLLLPWHRGCWVCLSLCLCCGVWNFFFFLMLFCFVVFFSVFLLKVCVLALAHLKKNIAFQCDTDLLPVVIRMQNFLI